MTSKRAAILKAATMLFAIKGYREASTIEVARLTGSAEGTVFYHFENKEKLFLAVLEEVRALIEGGLGEFLRSTEAESGVDVLDGLVGFYLQLAEDNEEEFMLLHRYHAYDLAKVNEECRALLEVIYERIIQAFEDAIQRGQDDGTMGHVPVRKTALLVFVMVDGLVRMKHYNLYDPGSVFEEFSSGVRRLVRAAEARG